jgi:cytochrome d ubiquinol oxidase subunit II
MPVVEIWFGILCLMLTGFAVLAGWDFGAGALHLVVARTEAERRTVLRALGPLWTWNEVWLVASGGVLFVAFPGVLATALAGTYLAVFLILWSLILRGISLEARSQIADPLWRSFWDSALAASSFLLAVLFGAALGNVIRGFPLDAVGEFSLPLFTDFGVRGHVGLLDWYTVSVGVFASISLCAHGATYLAWRTEGMLQARSIRFGRWLWMAAFALLPLLTAETWRVRPELFVAMARRPVAWLGVALVVSGTLALIRGTQLRRDLLAFLGSCAWLAGLLVAAAASLFPVMLKSTLTEDSVTAYGGSSSARSLAVALLWWPPALLLSLGYFTFIFRHYRGKVRPEEGASRS